MAMVTQAERERRQDPFYSARIAWQTAEVTRCYDPMLRLFDADDFQLLATRPRLVRRLKVSRRRALRLYLGPLRGDFVKAWTLCCKLSPVSLGSGLVLRLPRYWLAFHGGFALVWLHSSFEFSPVLAVNVEAMVRSARELEASAAQLLDVHQQVGYSASAAS